MAGPVPRIRNSGGGIEREDRLDMPGVELGQRRRLPCHRPLRRQQQRAVDPPVDEEAVGGEALDERARRPAGSRSNPGTKILVAAAALGAASPDPFGMKLSGRHPQPDQDRRGDVDRRIGADEDADEDRDGEAEDHVRAQDQQQASSASRIDELVTIVRDSVSFSDRLSSGTISILRYLRRFSRMRS